MVVPIYTPEDVTPLLLELARALRAHRYYPPGESALQQALERTARIWMGALERGTLWLEVRGGLLALAHGPVIRGAGIDEIGQELTRRGVLRLSFSPGLREAEIHVLIEALSRPPGDPAGPEGFARALARAGVQNLTVEGRHARDTPPEAPRDPRAPRIAKPTRESHAPAETPQPRLQAPEARARDGARGTRTPAAETSREPSAEPAEPGSPAELVLRLQELEACSDPALYASGVVRVSESAEKLVYRGHPGLAYEALLLVARDASDRNRSPSMRAAARERVRQLLSNDSLLHVVLEEMSSETAVANVKATELLLLCGRGVVAALLEAHGRASVAARERINAALVAMGDVAFPVLVEELASSQPMRVRRAARILGDMQHPRGVEFLVTHLRDPEHSICKEAATSLTRIGTRRAIDGLLEVLADADDERAQIAAAALGATRSERAGKALTELAAPHCRRSDPVRREAIRSLGRMQRSEAVPVLEQLIRKSGLLHRKRRRQLGMAAVHALRRIGGEAAFCALQEASIRGDSALRQHCAEALRLMGRMTAPRA